MRAGFAAAWGVEAAFAGVFAAGFLYAAVTHLISSASSVLAFIHSTGEERCFDAGRLTHRWEDMQGFVIDRDDAARATVTGDLMRAF